MANNLFRKEAVEHVSSSGVKGIVILNQPLSHWWFTVCSLSLILFIGTLLGIGEYSRKEIAPGYIMPDKGLIEIRTDFSGHIESVIVKQGQKVEKGDPIATVRKSIGGGNELSHEEGILSSLEKELNALIEEKKSVVALLESNMEELKSKIATIRESLKGISSQIRIVEEEESLARNELAKYKNFHKRKLVVESAITSRKKLLLEASLRLESLNERLNDQQGKLKVEESRLAVLPIEIKSKTLEFNQRIDQLKQRILAHGISTKANVVAPVSGKVALLDAHQGQSVSGNQLIASIIPEGSEYIALIKVPTKSIGFVEKGSKVNLNLEAFPFERYGFLEGKVKSISSGLSQDVGGDYFYKVIVELNQQDIRSRGRAYNLQPGMKFVSEIVLDTQSLWSWLVEPITSLKN